MDNWLVTTTIVRVPRHQHTTAKVVLREFTRNRLLTVFDRDSSSILCKGPDGAFYIDNFESIRPLEAEERWNTVENRLKPIYDLIRKRALFDDAAAVDTLIDLMALHWVRSPAVRLAHEQIADQVVEASRQRYRHADSLLSHAYTRRTGLIASTRGELDWINDQVHYTAAAEQREHWWSDRLLSNFDEARKIFGRSTIQVGFAHGTDFIIGDAPVITRKEGHDGLGPHQGVAIGDAVEIVMPIARDIIIGLGKEPAYIEVDRRAVERYNQFQVRTFQRWLACRPLGVSDKAMRKYIPARTIKSFKP